MESPAFSAYATVIHQCRGGTRPAVSACSWQRVPADEYQAAQRYGVLPRVVGKREKLRPDRSACTDETTSIIRSGNQKPADRFQPQARQRISMTAFRYVGRRHAMMRENDGGSGATLIEIAIV